jgi:predicted transcriptional regulator
MSQQDISDFLKRHRNRRFRRKEIAKAIGVSHDSINRCLNRMMKYSEVNEEKVRISLRGGKKAVIQREVTFYSYKDVKY